MNSLVVLSHPEPTSFAAALARTAGDVLGTDVVDLYADGFDPRLSAADFTQRTIPARLQPMDEQLHASRTGTFAPDLVPYSSGNSTSCTGPAWPGTKSPAS